MKRITGMIVSVFLLVGCSPSFEGEWVHVSNPEEEDNECPREIDFFGENQVSILPRNDNYERGTATYTQIKGSKYEISYGQGVSLHTSIKKSGNQLKVNFENVLLCTYKKE